MREIKFRGKRPQWKDWAHGDLIAVGKASTKEGKPLNYAIVENRAPFGAEMVLPETIGQYTGLKDRNGVEIYEGDILQICIDAAMTREREITAEVFWLESGIWAIRKTEANSEPLSFAIDGGCAVIGNIYDNSELLNPQQP